jgi:hypothetical protein
MGILGVRIVVDPFDEVVGQVETAVVVRAVFEIDNDEGGLDGVFPEEDVTLLEVVVAEHHGGVELPQVIPEQSTLLSKQTRGILTAGNMKSTREFLK